MKRAMSWQRARSLVAKPAQPHWFFNSSKGFFAVGAVAIKLGERQDFLLKRGDQHTVFVDLALRSDLDKAECELAGVIAPADR